MSEGEAHNSTMSWCDGFDKKIGFKIGFEIRFEIRFEIESKNRKETEEEQIEKTQNEKKEVNDFFLTKVGKKQRG